MKIIILTHKPRSYFSLRVKEEASKLGLSCESIPFRETAFWIRDGEVGSDLLGAEVKAVLSRPKTSLSSLMLYALSFTKVLEEKGLYVLNPFKGYLNTLDKAITYRNLCNDNLPVPDSMISPSQERLMEMPTPFFLKPIYGSRGRDIMLVDGFRVLPDLEGHRAWVAQVPTRDEDWDVRALVLGGNFIIAVKRVSKGLVTNLSRGASVEEFEAGKEVRELAVKAAEALNCRFAGVDVAFKGGEAFILDVNSQPDFMGVEGVLKVNVAHEIVRYVASEARD